jgi:hypothetical protein
MDDENDIVVGDGQTEYLFPDEEGTAAAAAATPSTTTISDSERIQRTMARASEFLTDIDGMNTISDPEKMQKILERVKHDKEISELAGSNINEKFDTKKAAEKISEISKNPEKLEKMFSHLNEMTPEDKFHQKNAQQLKSKAAAVSSAPKSRAEILKMKKNYEEARRNAPKVTEKNYKLKKAVILKRNGKFKTVDINVDNNMKAVSMFIRCEKISMFTYNYRDRNFLVYYNGEDVTTNKKALFYLSKKIGGDVLFLSPDEENVTAEFFDRS